MDIKIEYLKNNEIKNFIISILELTSKILPNENFEGKNFYSDNLDYNHLLIWRKNEPNSKLFIKKLDAI